jgi:hypothetical protein
VTQADLHRELLRPGVLHRPGTRVVPAIESTHQLAGCLVALVMLGGCSSSGETTTTAPATTTTASEPTATQTGREPVYALVQKACQKYDKGVKCFATAASVGDESGATVAVPPRNGHRQRQSTASSRVKATAAISLPRRRRKVRRSKLKLADDNPASAPPPHTRREYSQRHRRKTDMPN